MTTSHHIHIIKSAFLQIHFFGLFQFWLIQENLQVFGQNLQGELEWRQSINITTEADHSCSPPCRMNVTEIRVCQNHEYYMCVCIWNYVHARVFDVCEDPVLSSDADYQQRGSDRISAATARVTTAAKMDRLKERKVQRKTRQPALDTLQRSSRTVVTRHTCTFVCVMQR